MKWPTLTKNFAALLGSNFAVQGLRFLTMVLLARRFGNTLFGVYNYIILLVGYGFILVEFGLKNFAIREFSQGRGSRELVSRIFKMRALLAGLGCLVIVGFTHRAFPSGVYFWSSVFFGLSLLVDAFLVDFIIISKENLTTQALGNILQALFLYLAVYFLVGSGQTLTLVAQLFLISQVLWVGFFLLKAGVSGFSKGNNPDDRGLFQIARGGMPFLIAQLFGTIMYSMDLLLLGQFHFESWLGDYSAALKILGIPLGIISAMLGAIQPRLARHSHDFASSDLGQLIGGTTRFVWIFIVPTVLGCWFFGDQLVLWIFGSHFIMTAQLLRPLSFVFALFCLSLAPVHTLYVSTKTDVIVKITFLSLALSFVVIGTILYLNRPDLVPWGMILVQLFYLMSAWRAFGFRGILSREDWIVIVPACLMILPLALPAAIPAWFRFTASAAAYGLGLAVMKLWTRSWFVDILRSS